MQLVKDGYYLFDDPDQVNLTSLKRLLEKSYWAKDRSIDTIKTTIKNSLCFSVYKGGRQIAFARVVTDYATFGYIADLIVEDQHRAKGIGKWLMEVIVKDERFKDKLLMLATNDAHTLYEKYGFKNNHKLMSTHL